MPDTIVIEQDWCAIVAPDDWSPYTQTLAAMSRQWKGYERSQDEIVEFLMKRRGDLLLAKLRGQTEGFALYAREEHPELGACLRIELLGIDTDRHYLGLGKLLIAALYQKAHEWGARPVILLRAADADGAEFLGRVGFEPHGAPAGAHQAFVGTSLKTPKPPSKRQRKKREPVRAHIRWMIRRDMPEVLRIEQATAHEPWVEEDFLRCLRQRNCIGMVAERGERVVGYMVYELFKSALLLVKCAVHPREHGQTIGTQLIEKLKTELTSSRRTKILTIAPFGRLSIGAKGLLVKVAFQEMRSVGPVEYQNVRGVLWGYAIPDAQGIVGPLTQLPEGIRLLPEFPQLLETGEEDDLDDDLEDEEEEDDNDAEDDA